ncbi:PEP-CTERM sorting domain-containing protein [Coleofasciculus sp. G1-WW12-02]|uniref:PEP-CTERM sorting domain-containing protein n=1 Tax=Coleofasciculus sp. G1-WW12-02 TaxID=3068483 RepID=UPI004063FE9F
MLHLQGFANLFNGQEFRAVARFQAVDGAGFSGASDKLLVSTISNSDPGDDGEVSVPEPGTLAGLALIGGSLAAARRRKSC